MLEAALYLAVVFALSVSFGVLFRTERRLGEVETWQTQPYDDRALRTALDRHSSLIEELQKLDAAHEAWRSNFERAYDEREREVTLAIAEGIERVDRSERRVKAVVSRAKKRLEDEGFTDAALEAEGQLLLGHDGAGSEGEGVQPMRDGLEGAPNGHSGRDMSAFPGAWG